MGLLDLFGKSGKKRFVFEAKRFDDGMAILNRGQLVSKLRTQLPEIYNEPSKNIVFFSADEWSGGVYPNIHTSAEQQENAIQDMLAYIMAKGYKVKDYDINQTSIKDLSFGTFLIDMIVMLE